jgi:hypothetical protein
VRRMDSPTDRVGQLGHRRFRLFDIGVRVLMSSDGECGAKEAGRRIESWNLDGERVIRGGATIGGHGCNIADPSWVGRTGQDGRAMWALCHTDGFPIERLVLGDVEHDFTFAVIWPQAFAYVYDSGSQGFTGVPD